MVEEITQNPRDPGKAGRKLLQWVGLEGQKTGEGMAGRAEEQTHLPWSMCGNSLLSCLGAP